jgi:hypothetical protein
MGYSSTIFRQMLNLVPRVAFDNDVDSLGANRYTKHFKAWCQFVANLYAQASGKKSLRDVETGLRVQQKSWFHLGLKGISRSQLSYMNQRRDARLYQNLYYHLLKRCVDMAGGRSFKFKYPVKILDSTLVKLCLSLYPWGKYRKQKGALKLHTLLDVRSQIPDVIVMTDGKQHDVKAARRQEFALSPDSILVVDKAYVDFQWLHDLNEGKAFFVTRVKENMQVEDLGQHQPIQEPNVIADRIALLKLPQSFKKYPNRLRLVTYYDETNDRSFTFMTNHFNLSAATIAELYKSRWDIELFFKWIKQNLKIKSFLGTSQNAVLIQVWTAMIYYLLLAYIKHQTRYSYSLLHLTRVIKEALFKTADIIDLLGLSPEKLPLAREPDGQMLLFDLS